MSCHVYGDLSGAGGPYCCGCGGPHVVDVEAVAEGPCEGPWCHAQRKPQLPSQPRRASGSCGMSCPVCLCLAPEDSWYPLTSPGKFFGGKKGSGCRGRAEGTEAMAPELPALPWPPEPLATPWSPELPAPPWPPELPAPPWSPLSVCSALEVPVLCSCPCLSWGASRALPSPPLPSPPRWNCYGVGHTFREGGVMSGFCCVSSVPASCVHIWFVSCPCLMSLWVNACLAVFVSLSVNNLCILVHACSVWFRLVYSLLPGVSCLSVLPWCPH